MQCCCIIKPHRSTTYVIYVSAKIAWTSVSMVIADMVRLELCMPLNGEKKFNNK